MGQGPKGRHVIKMYVKNLAQPRQGSTTHNKVLLNTVDARKQSSHPIFHWQAVIVISRSKISKSESERLRRQLKLPKLTQPGSKSPLQTSVDRGHSGGMLQKRG